MYINRYLNVSPWKQSSFQQELLPEPSIYYSDHLGQIRFSSLYAKARCPFPDHEDKNPSFSFNLKTGAYRCFGCGRNVGDVLGFQQEFYNQDFKTAAQTLGAWEGGLTW